MAAVAELGSLGGLDFMIIKQDSARKRESRWKDSGWTLFCRLFLCGTGIFFIGYGVYDYIKHGHYLSALIGLILIGVLFICVVIFTSAKTCEKIADGITCGF